MSQNIEFLYSRFLLSDGVSTDTRTLRPDQLFFGLNGPNFKGSMYAQKALELGASFAVVDDRELADNQRIYWVNDVLQTLQDLAAFHRSRFKRPVIALTGSNGKTTTKELLQKVLSKNYTVHATSGNLNNHIGVPLTILGIYPQVEIAVIEMGANRIGDIKELCKIAQPTHGLITCIGHAHTETFGGIDGVLKGKTELFDYLQQTNGKIFFAGSDEYLAKVSSKYAYTSRYDSSDWNVIQQVPFLEVDWKGNHIKTHLTGAYNIQNMSATACVASHFQVKDVQICEALAEYSPSNMRSQILKKEAITIVLDAYNANPDSMKLAIQNFSQFQGKKGVVLGQMNELENPSSHHQKILEQVKESAFDIGIFIGPHFLENSNKYPEFVFFESVEKAAIYLKNVTKKVDNWLLKSSRSSQLEKLLPILE